MTKKEDLIKMLEHYKVEHKDENISKLVNFLKENENAYSRTNLGGHITCSTWILNKECDEVFLIHHAKYDKWLQPGGHMEIGENIFQAGLREGMEETGFSDLKLMSEKIFDIDIHKIPNNEKKSEPEHYHYDIRLIATSLKKEVNVCEKEVKGYDWTKINKLKLITNDPSLFRMVNKTEKLKEIKEHKNNKFKKFNI
jgi:8-oxo-dGTP pyrophosphatase MutT (NUDIX family)